MIFSNHWNQIIYKLWSPFYDRIFDRLLFASVRKDIFRLLSIQPGERVLLVGIGTGADLRFLTAGAAGYGLDISQAMLRQAKAKVTWTDASVALVQADAQTIPIRLFVNLSRNFA